jgi:hypothetical protein
LFQKLLVKLNNYALHRSRPRQLWRSLWWLKSL